VADLLAPPRSSSTSLVVTSIRAALAAIVIDSLAPTSTMLVGGPSASALYPMLLWIIPATLPLRPARIRARAGLSLVCSVWSFR
jgi:hypothetical protein